MAKYNEALVAQMDKIMADLPEAKAGKMFGMPAYKVNGKLAVSAFEDIIVAKVGAERAQAMIGKNGVQPFEPLPGRVWKDWVAVSGSLDGHDGLLEEAVRFVAVAG